MSTLYRHTGGVLSRGNAYAKAGGSLAGRTVGRKGDLGGPAPAAPPPPETTFPTVTGLLARFKSTHDVTASTGSVSAWGDQSGNARHATQATGGNQPTVGVDPFGRQVVRFYGASQQFLTFAESYAFDSRNVAVFIVARACSGYSALLGLNGYSGGMFGFSSSNGNTDPQHLQAFGQDTGAKYLANKVLLGLVSNGTTLKHYTNQAQTGTTLSAATAGTWTGGLIGKSTAGSHASMDLYEVIVAPGSISNTDRQAIIDYCVTEYGLPTSAYTKNLVCVGDSLVQGTRPNADLGYVSMIERPSMAAWRIVNNGVGGNTIPLIVARAAATDGYLISGARNVLTIADIANDLGAGTSVATWYANLVSYVQARVTAGWEVWAHTPMSMGSARDAQITEARQRVRGTNGYTGIVADAGATGVIDIGALSQFAGATANQDTTYYYTDGLHTTLVGAQIEANEVARVLAAT